MKSHNFAPRVALCVAMSLAAQLAALYTCSVAKRDGDVE
jgi:hypothetical protein